MNVSAFSVMLDQSRSTRSTAVPGPGILKTSAGFAPSFRSGKSVTVFVAVRSWSAAVFFAEYATSCSGLNASPTCIRTGTVAPGFGVNVSGTSQ